MENNYLSEAEFIQVLREFVKQKGTQEKAARALGVDGSYVNSALHGWRGRAPGPAIVQALGYRRVIMYVKDGDK
jgi:hypothetical protein